VPASWKTVSAQDLSKALRGIYTKSSRKRPVSTLRSLCREISKALELVIDRMNGGFRNLPSGNLV
jgi:hypothetical protein